MNLIISHRFIKKLDGLKGFVTFDTFDIKLKFALLMLRFFKNGITIEIEKCITFYS